MINLYTDNNWCEIMYENSEQKQKHSLFDDIRKT